MKSKSQSYEDLDTIRKIMEKSTRFLSLSGLSGVFAGLIALAGSAVAFFLIFKGHIRNEYFSGLSSGELNIIRFSLILDAIIVLTLAIAISLYFSYRKALRQGSGIWTPVSRRLLLSMFVPLATGGILIIIMYTENLFQFIIPSMLIFYGLALVSAEKFTFSEIFYLGLFEIVLGLIAALIPEFGIFIWAVGFGFLHIIYGLVMYRKYER